MPIGVATVIRSVWLVRLVQEAVPPALIPVFVFITSFGSAGVLLVVLALWYWLDGRHRRQSAFVLAMSICGYGLTLALKEIFALPRPPTSLHLISISGYGFPSGHAIESTVVYGSLALVLTSSTRRRRLAGAGVMIGLISLSRVVLGVHYPADVLGGIIAGGAFLLGAIRLTKRDPLRGFGLAASVAAVAFLISSSSRGVLMLAASAGGALGWWVGPPPVTRSLKAGLAIAAFGIAILVGGSAVMDNNAPLALKLLAAALAFSGIVALPTVAHRAATLRRRWPSSQL